LFQLFCITGDWDRALVQLGSAATLDSSTEEMARAYREVIRCEVYRGKVFGGSKAPLFVGEPDVWLGQLVESLRLNSMGSHKDAAVLRAEALEAAPTSKGTISGQPFEWISDADMRLGPVVEAIVNGKYYWIPFHRLLKVEIDTPEDLRDLVWIPAKLTFATGGEQVAFLPTRYPETQKSGNDEFLLARKTDWLDIGNETYVGTGQRMLATDQGEFAILDTRIIQLG
jgi:type VI secretion system protein ImpE